MATPVDSEDQVKDALRIPMSEEVLGTSKLAGVFSLVKSKPSRSSVCHILLSFRSYRIPGGLTLQKKSLKRSIVILDRTIRGISPMTMFIWFRKMSNTVQFSASGYD